MSVVHWLILLAGLRNIYLSETLILKWQNRKQIWKFFYMSCVGKTLTLYSQRLLVSQDRIMFHAVRLPFIAASPFGICGEWSVIETGFFPSTPVYPCQYHSTHAPYSIHQSPTIYDFSKLTASEARRLKQCIPSQHPHYPLQQPFPVNTTKLPA